MACEVQCKVGENIYLYESVSYRNGEGKPRNKRTPIGKIDPNTGAKVYKPEYIERMKAAGTPVTISETQAQFSVNDIRQSQVLDFGVTHLLKELAAQSGLAASLAAASPKHCGQIYALASHLVASGDPYMYCQEWLDAVGNMEGIGDLSSQRISEILGDISFEERESFYQEWCVHRADSEYLALDITSTSSYSELIDDVEWGYNRDGEDLAQINLCMLMGETSRLPIYQTVYSGSLKDVSTLRTTLSKFAAIAGDKSILTVMDKGFCSKKNIDALLDENKKFIIALPFTLSFAKQQVTNERESIDELKNVILSGGDSLRAVTRTVPWDDEHDVYAHVFFNPLKSVKDREKIFARTAEMWKNASAQPEKYLDNEQYQKFLNIQKHGSSEYTVGLRQDVIENTFKNAGWLVIISNEIDNAEDALRIYRAKDVVEKGFMKLKNSLDLGRLRVHGDTAVQNKVFIGFVALILLSQIHNVMSDKGLYKKWTMKQLLRILAKHRVHEIKNCKIYFPLTKDQRAIYSAFDLDVPA
jgi:transposase